MLVEITLAAAMLNAFGAEAQRPPKKPKTVTLTGCVERDEREPDQFTIVDRTAGTKYRLTGKEFIEYLGRPVQIDGGIVVKGVTIRGGLQPNPNIAAQAGAIDPARAAVQAQTSGSMTPPASDIQEFRVKTIRATGGTCK